MSVFGKEPLLWSSDNEKMNIIESSWGQNKPVIRGTSDFMSPDPVVQVQKESHKEHGVAMAMAPNQKGTSVVTLWIFWRREEGN